MQIKEVVIQGLIKQSGSTDITENFRDDLSIVDERMEKLANDVLAIYGRNINNYGCFDPDTQTYPFYSYLQSYYANVNADADDLISLSKATCRLIASRMKASHSATGGYICFLRYESQSRDWLLVVVLKLKTNTGIDPTTLDLNESLVFDVDNLHEAARIDLEKFQSDSQPYLSFIKSSKRTDRVTEYFRLALGCTDYTDSQSHTDQTIKAMDEYFKDNDYTPEQRQEARRKAYEYFDEKKKRGEPVNLKAFSAIINDQAPDSFVDFIREKEYSISETFDPHPKTYMRIKRISAKFGNISVAFDMQDVIAGIIDYDEATQNLIINKPSDTLITKIKEAKGDESTKKTS